MHSMARRKHGMNERNSEIIKMVGGSAISTTDRVAVTDDDLQLLKWLIGSGRTTLSQCL
jgi:hypothetical protein